MHMLPRTSKSAGSLCSIHWSCSVLCWTVILSCYFSDIDSRFAALVKDAQIRLQTPVDTVRSIFLFLSFFCIDHSKQFCLSRVWSWTSRSSLYLSTTWFLTNSISVVFLQEYIYYRCIFYYLCIMYFKNSIISSNMLHSVVFF